MGELDDDTTTVGRAQADRVLAEGLEILLGGARTQRGLAKYGGELGMAKTAVEKTAQTLGPDGLRDAVLRTTSADFEWMGYEGGMAAALQVMQDIGGELTRENILAVIEASVSYQFKSPGTPVAWSLHGLAMVASRAWEGPSPAPESAQIATAFLQRRAECYRAMEPGIRMFFEAAMMATNLTAGDRWSADKVMRLQWALMDGGVLRIALDDGAFTVHELAEAMLILGEALGVPASGAAARDPRRAQLSGTSPALFDSIVVYATNQYLEGASRVNVNDARVGAGVDDDLWITVDRWFPSWKALADSCLRSLVEGSATLGAVDAPGRPDPRILIALRKLADVADTAPLLPRIVDNARPTEIRPSGLIETLEYEFGAWAAGEGVAPDVTDPRTMIEAALQGSTMLCAELGRQLGDHAASHEGQASAP